PKEVRNVAMVGAGLMGGGIASVTSSIARIPVRFKEEDDEALGRGCADVPRVLDERARRKRTTRMEQGEVGSRVTGTTRYEGFGNVDLVIEAVFEDLDLKHRVIRELEEVTKDDCILASNTSTPPISRLAEASRRPENLVGMHYFSPVEKMPLL